VLEPLPIDAAIDEIRSKLRARRSVVVVAEPGSGKTTRVPPALLDAGPTIVLQPRRAAARSIARRIAAERSWTLGVQVGWQIRFERKFQHDTRLLIATEGILTARLQQDPLLSDFATIVLDEFHERSIHADLALALSRQAMQAREDLRLVIMSATIDAEQVASFLGDCDVVRVPGRRHAVTVGFEPSLDPAAAVRRALEASAGNVLCFQPGSFEIERTIASLRPGLPDVVDVLPLHGGLPAAKQDLALDPRPGRRRVIVCTNIAETSITIPGVTAVVDVGLEKVARYDADRAIDSLQTERISQAAADQRAGRAGRTGPGIAYRLWSPLDRLKPFREPEIHRVDLSGVVLDISGWGGDPRHLEWFDAPRPEAIDAAMALLNGLGALRGTALTDIGRRMLRLPLPPRLARILVAGNSTRDAVRAVTILSERYQSAARPETTSSDLSAALDRWAELPDSLHLLADQLERLSHVDRVRSQPADRDAALRQAVLTGYPDRIGQRREPHSSRFLLSTGTGAALSDRSGVRNAEFIVALNLRAPVRIDDSESRIDLASAVDREWLRPSATEVEHRLDTRGVVKAREVDRYGALVLAERPIPPNPDAAAALLMREWLARPTAEDDRRLLARIRFAGRGLDLTELVGMAARNASSLGDIDLAGSLPRELALALERDAPEWLSVPSGRRVRLAYATDGSVSASVKLQELFGLAETPRIGPRREPLLLELLAPNGRAVQLTRDLRSFWDRTYPEVRRELRGRYPKHPWPEDPWQAAPTHRARPRRR
jgi:ATP-dependent RNA helicase HrpB